MYKCSECGAPVKVTEEGIVRTCEHEGKGIVADMEAEAFGVGEVE